MAERGCREGGRLLFAARHSGSRSWSTAAIRQPSSPGKRSERQRSADRLIAPNVSRRTGTPPAEGARDDIEPVARSDTEAEELPVVQLDALSSPPGTKPPATGGPAPVCRSGQLCPQHGALRQRRGTGSGLRSEADHRAGPPLRRSLPWDRAASSLSLRTLGAGGILRAARAGSGRRASRPRAGASASRSPRRGCTAASRPSQVSLGPVHGGLPQARARYGSRSWSVAAMRAASDRHHDGGAA